MVWAIICVLVPLAEVSVLRLIGKDWAETVSLILIGYVAAIAGRELTRYRARQRGLSERGYRRLHRGIRSGAVPDDLADHPVVGSEIDAEQRGAIGVLVLFSVLFGGATVLSIVAAAHGDMSPWLIAAPAAVLAFGLALGVRMLRGSGRARERLAGR
jgi:hypothetical protein